MASGIEVEDLAVQGMRQPRQRMPVSFAKSRERPLHRVPGQAALNVKIFQDVGRVIKVDELVVDDGIVESESGRRQQETQDDNVHFAGCGHVGSWRRLRWPKVRSFSTRSRAFPAETILTRRRGDLDDYALLRTNRR